MGDHVQRRLHWFLLLGTVLFLAGLTLACFVALRTSAWMSVTESRLPDYPLTDQEWDQWNSRTDEEWDQFRASDEVDIRLNYCANLLMPLGAGTLLSGIASLPCLNKARFSMRSLFLGMTFVCLAIGIPAAVWPRLHSPRLSFYPANYAVGLGQSGKPASSGGQTVATPWTLATAACRWRFFLSSCSGQSAVAGSRTDRQPCNRAVCRSLATGG